MEICGYHITRKFRETSSDIVYRGHHKGLNRFALIKLPREDYPSPEHLRRIKHEYLVASLFTHNKILKPLALEEHGHRLAIIYEDFDGLPLTSITKTGVQDLAWFLDIAIQLTDGIREIHRQKIIYKNLSPNTILYRSVTGRIRLSDFSISSQSSREQPDHSSSTLPEGQVRYVSPEQTGRVDLPLDFRTDFYSLGIVLYELLTGTHPFETSDPMEMVHCHLAKTPPGPHEVDVRIPKAISKIILKLLEKSPEKRYQSCNGLTPDLMKCLIELRNYRDIIDFSIGKDDISVELTIPDKLYGRTAELGKIISFWEQTKEDNPGHLLITGNSGVGKTVLLKEAKKIIKARRGMTISAKIDQIRQSTPYAPLIKGLKELLQNLLLAHPDEIERWKQTLLSSLDSQGQVILDVLPDLELIIGPQPEVESLQPAENQHRFRRVFRQFISACSELARSLTIILDDLQWIDRDTLDLVESIATDKTISCSFLGSYRSSEVEHNHPLTAVLQHLHDNNISFQRLSLENLPKEDIIPLLSETLFCPVEITEPLAQACLNKTDGNPFFLKEFLKELDDSGCLRFNQVSGRWDFDLARINNRKVMKNVGEILIQRISGFSEQSRKILMLAACIGNDFGLSTLSLLSGKSLDETMEDLKQPLLSGVIIPDTSPSASGFHPQTDQSASRYTFAHDQIQRAAYALIPENDVQQYHQHVGELLLKTLPRKAREQHLFEIVSHLNKGASLISDQQAKNKLAVLNIKAAGKAKKSAAYRLYYQFTQTAYKLLPADCWETDYDFTLSIYTEAAESTALNGRFEEAEFFCDGIRDNARSFLDKVGAYQIKIRSYKSANRLEQAVETGLESLRELGVKFPRNPSKLQIFTAMMQTKLLLLGKKPADLLNGPEMTDPHAKIIMGILLDIGTAAYYARPRLVPLISFTAIKLTLRYGNNIVSAVMAYPSYGFLLCGLPLGNIQQGYEFGLMALAMQKKLDYGQSPLPIYLVNNLIIHWKQHIRTTLSPLLEAYRLGQKSGESEITANSAYCYCYRLLLLGHNLEVTAQEHDYYLHAIEQTNQKIPLYRQLLFRQSVACLRDNEDNGASINGRFYNPELLYPEHEQNKDYTTIFIYHLLSMMHTYHFGDSEQCLEHGAKAQPLLSHAVSSLFIPLFYFYQVLGLMDFHSAQLPAKPSGVVKKIRKGLKKIECWASHAPENYRHKYYLLRAEFECILDHRDQAADYYDRSIVTAHQNGYIQDQALALERAAHFYAKRNRGRIAIQYLDEAIICYQKWGAQALVKSLRAQRHTMIEKLFPDQSRPYLDKPDILGTIESNDSVVRLDMMSVIKASRAFTGEIILGDLLKKLIIILLENAGGHSGFLLLPQDGFWMVKAHATAADHSAELLDLPPSLLADQLCQTIINYVLRSNQTVVLDDAANQGMFTHDSYIIDKQSKSILCMPIVHQSEMICLLYLENGLTVSAFHPDRLETIKLIASQAAISIKNSRLYEDLEGTVDKLHREITKRKETQMQLLHAGKLSALGRLSASIAHEFGNPLIGIKYLLDDLEKREALSGDDRKLIKIGLEECQRMKSLINDLQDLHRPSSGFKKEFSLNETTQNVLLFQRKNLKNLNISVITELAPELPILYAVEDQITQVLVNLTINAADSMREAGGRLNIRTWHDDSSVYWEVSDTGCGIPEQFHEHVFEPFYSTKEAVDGTGLGLAISYSIVKNHGGDISFSSTPEKGSTFSVSLPIGTQDLRVDGELSAATTAN
ncbi:MAG: GAF domain-containing protein [Desulfobulbaceae bacterium]|nr:MAG: GAF domain-containing protein [Desulfobulbaceae bacterium]